jgi:hypothetical protein
MASRRDREALMGSMEEFIHYEKLIIFKRQLADPSITDERRRMLARLLALEEAKRFHEKDDGHATIDAASIGIGQSRARIPRPMRRGADQRDRARRDVLDDPRRR